MILTGKAEENFFNWLDNQGTNGIDISNWEFEKFHLLSNVSQNSLIIEWFDSIKYNEIWSLWDFSFKKIFYSNNNLSILQIQEQAIKKANEIYNEKICQI